MHTDVRMSVSSHTHPCTHSPHIYIHTLVHACIHGAHPHPPTPSCSPFTRSPQPHRLAPFPHLYTFVHSLRHTASHTGSLSISLPLGSSLQLWGQPFTVSRLREWPPSGDWMPWAGEQRPCRSAALGVAPCSLSPIELVGAGWGWPTGAEPLEGAQHCVPSSRPPGDRRPECPWSGTKCWNSRNS